MRTPFARLLAVIVFTGLCYAARSNAQACNDFNVCTTPDTCADGVCNGTPASGASCDDGNVCTGPDTCASGACVGAPLTGGNCDDDNECTISDTCASGQCQGTPVADGSSCGGGQCGMCEAGVCMVDPVKANGPCNDGSSCTTNDTCQGALSFVFCLGQQVLCDPDDNKCTFEACNPANGLCQSIDLPCGDCKTCNPAVGCQAANDGNACDDFNDCTAGTTCTSGECLIAGPAGTPTDTPTGTPTDTPTEVGTPTDTPTEGVGTPTDTPTEGISTPTDTPTEGGTPTDTPTEGISTPTDTPTEGGTPTDTPTEGLSTPTDTPTEGGTPTDTPTEGPSATPTDTEIVLTPTDTPTGTPTGTATATVTFTATGTPAGTTATVTATATGTPAGTATATVTSTATGTPAGTATATVTATATPTTPGGATATITATPTIPPPATSTVTASASPTALPVDASIIVGGAAGEPGSTVTIDVSLETTVEVAGTQNDITFDPKARIKARENGRPSCTVNAAINKGGTSFAFEPPDCTPGTDCTSVRALVLALDNTCPICGTSTTECPDVAPCPVALYTCDVEIAADATGEIPLPCSNAGSGDPDGNPIGTDCTNGTIVVAAPSDATISIGSAVGAAGEFVSLPVSLDTEIEVAGTQNDLTYPPEAAVAAGTNGRPMCAANPAINKGGTSFAFQPPGCSPGTDCTSVRALVLALDNVCPICGTSTTECPDLPTCPAVLYTCTIAIAAGAADGTYPITCSNAGASDPDGNAVGTNCTDGSVVVGVQPTATNTATVTNTPPAESPTPTPTATPATPATPPTPTSTITPAAPSPTPTKFHFNDSSSCEIVAGSQSRPAWMLLIPAALLLGLRRRRH